jgi:nitrilase
MREPVVVACVQVEPVLFDRHATIEKIDAIASDVAARGAAVVVFPETFIPVYPSSRWVRFLAGDGDGKAAFALLARESIEIPGPASDRLGQIAGERGLWLAVGANELERGTIYNSLLLYSPEGRLELHHRKLVPTNHERLVWGAGDGRGLGTVATPHGRMGGLICWENQMPLARFALYEAGVEIYLAPTADDSEAWHDSLRHIARESRAFVISPCVYQRAASYPAEIELADGPDLIGRGGSAILGPDGGYLAGPLWDEEGLLLATLDPQLLYEERQRFDPAGHYHRPDVLSLRVRRPTRS